MAERPAQAREGQQEAGEPDRRGPARPAAGRLEGLRDRRRDRHRRPGPQGRRALPLRRAASSRRSMRRGRPAVPPSRQHAKDDVTKPKSERAVAAKAEKAGKAEYSG